MTTRDIYRCGGCGAPGRLESRACWYCGGEYKGQVDTWHLKDGLMEPPDETQTIHMQPGDTIEVWDGNKYRTLVDDAPCHMSVDMGVAGDDCSCRTFWDMSGMGFGGVTTAEIAAGSITATRLRW